MDFYKVTCLGITGRNRMFKSGDIVAEKDLSPDAVESFIRLGKIKPCLENGDDLPEAPAETVEETTEDNGGNDQGSGETEETEETTDDEGETADEDEEDTRSEIDKLRDKYLELSGKESVNKSWGIPKLTKEIEALEAGTEN